MMARSLRESAGRLAAPALRALCLVSRTPERPPLVRVVLNEDDLEEKFVRGTGPGGQAVAKTSNKVQLTYKPLGIMVACHEHRSLDQNRREARRKLIDILDEMANKNRSKPAQRMAKAQKRKAKKHKRTREKYHADCGVPESEESGEEPDAGDEGRKM